MSKNKKPTKPNSLDFGAIMAALGLLARAVKNDEEWSARYEQAKKEAYSALGRIGAEEHSRG